MTDPAWLERQTAREIRKVRNLCRYTRMMARRHRNWMYRQRLLDQL